MLAQPSPPWEVEAFKCSCPDGVNKQINWGQRFHCFWPTALWRKSTNKLGSCSKTTKRKFKSLGFYPPVPIKAAFLDCPKEEKKQAGIEMEIAHSSLQISLQMPLQPTYPPNPALPCKALPAQNSCTASIAAFPPPLLLILLPSVGWVYFWVQMAP